MDKELSQWDKGKVLLVDKPVGWTSFDVVNKIRFAIKTKKVGHAGTLDPLATGLLIICTGKFTKRIEEFMGAPKEYTGTITLGKTTPSYDAETEPDAIFPTDHLTEALLLENTKQFIGNIQQLPPMYSAIKVDGKRLYEHARKGREIEVQPRSVEITKFELSRIAIPEVDFIVQCSKGTYIRSLAYDFGKAVNAGGYLSSLRRTAIGEHKITDALPLEQLLKLIQSGVEFPD
ncbi:MAG: tRNA pseudouridine(55) synthase TruB [Flexibacteraceae bacterium]